MVRPEQYDSKEALNAEARLGMALDCLKAVQLLTGMEAARDVKLMNPSLSHGYPTWQEEHGGQIESLQRMRRYGRSMLPLESIVTSAETAENLVEDLFTQVQYESSDPST